MAQVAAGILPQVSVYGAHYPTPDGTGSRDYIHVVDLAKGQALGTNARQPDLLTINCTDAWRWQKTNVPVK